MLAFAAAVAGWRDGREAFEREARVHESQGRHLWGLELAEAGAQAAERRRGDGRAQDGEVAPEVVQPESHRRMRDGERHQARAGLLHLGRRGPGSLMLLSRDGSVGEEISRRDCGAHRSHLMCRANGLPQTETQHGGVGRGWRRGCA